jgi:GntR family transcriptional regulator
MAREWNDSQPIYRQIRDRVVAMILDGALKEGDALPRCAPWRRTAA